MIVYLKYLPLTNPKKSAPVQQVFHDSCSEGLNTEIKSSEICLVGIGELPDASTTVCNTYTGMPLACVNGNDSEFEIDDLKFSLCTRTKARYFLNFH